MQTAPREPNSSNDESRTDYFFVYGAGIAVTFALGLALFAYERYAGDWVDALDEQIGEIVAGRARRLLLSDQNEEAIAGFQRALAVGFSDDIQRVWVSHDLARLHLALGQYDDAIAVSRSCMELIGENGEAFGIWHEALRAQQKSDDAQALTLQWYEWGQRKNQPASMAWAMFYRGSHLEARKQHADALEAFETGLRADAGGNVNEVLASSIERLRKAQ